MTAIDIAAYEPDAETLIAAIPRHRGAQWLDELNGEGVGRFQLHRDDPVMVAHPELLAGGTIFKMRAAGAADWQFAFHVEDPTPAPTTSDDNAGRWLTIAGRGVITILQAGIVFPEVLREGMSDERAFDFSSLHEDTWYEGAYWVAPVGIRQDSALSGRVGSPKDWPDGGAEWVWSTSPAAAGAVGRHWFRGHFTLATAQSVTIFASADDALDVRIDGDPVLASDVADRYVWKQTYSTTVFLDAGDHVVAAAVDNRGGAGAFLCSVYSVNSDGSPNVSLTHTSPGAFVVCTDAHPPGWRGAEVLWELITECRARGNTPLDDVTLGFGQLFDADTETWTDRHDRTFKIGTDLLDVIRQVSELSLDFAMTPDLILRAWKRRGADLTGTVELIATGPDTNVTDHTPTLRLGTIRNCGLVRFGTGWLVVSDPWSVAAHRRRETALSVPSAQTEAQALQVVQALWDEVSGPQVTLPFTMTSARGPQPYDDFDNGDTITAPGVDGTPGPARLMSIAAADAGTHVVWGLDLYAEG